MSNPQPKIVQKMALRFAIGLFILAGLLAGYNFLRTYGQDFNNLGSTDTKGWIAALRDNEEGTQLVVIKPNGEVLESPKYRAGANDREYSWRPDGNQLMFVSDREENTFRLFRWNLANGSLEVRTAGTRNFANPVYPPAGAPDATASALVTSGGFVAEFDPVKLSVVQVLPPTGREIQLGEEEGSGGTGQFDALYKSIGNSFKEARYTADKSFIVALMRGDEGEVLIAQRMQATEKGLQPPQVLASGATITFDVSPVGNVVVYSVNEFKFPDPNRIPPDFVKNGRVVLPFRHLVGISDLEKPEDREANGPVVSSKDDEVSFTSPHFAPDGASFALGVGKFEEATLIQRLVNIPARVGGAAAGSPLIDGAITDFGWSPDGKSLVFVKVVDGKRGLYTVGADGGGQRLVLEGDFGRPSFSPQSN